MANKLLYLPTMMTKLLSRKKEIKKSIKKTLDLLEELIAQDSFRWEKIKR